MKNLLFLTLILGLFFSCNKDEQRAIDEEILQDYFLENNLTVEKHEESGVYYRITEEGNGVDFPQNNFSTIRVFYKGYLLGNEADPFDERIEGEDDYLQIQLGSLVYGWQVALLNFSKGSKGFIYIPSHAGYGNAERPGVPEDSILVFEIHLINVFN